VTGSEAGAIKVENQVGHDLATEIKKQLKLDREHQSARILNEIGPNLTKCVARKLRTFNFEIVKSDEPNAFALPGGFIFITHSLVELCDRNQDELAFILGHEMGHVIRGHAMKRILSNSAINVASHAVSIHGQFTAWLQKVGIQFLESAYSQELEFQADKLGVCLADTAGYVVDSAGEYLIELPLVVSDSTYPFWWKGELFSPSKVDTLIPIIEITRYLNNSEYLVLLELPLEISESLWKGELFSPSEGDTLISIIAITRYLDRRGYLVLPMGRKIHNCIMKW